MTPNVRVYFHPNIIQEPEEAIGEISLLNYDLVRLQRRNSTSDGVGLHEIL